MTRVSAAGRDKYAAAPTAKATTAVTATVQGTSADRRERGSGARAADGPSSSASAISMRAVDTSAIRNFASLTRHRARSRRIDDGVSAGSRVQSGSLLITAASVSVTSSPGNARVPVSISYSTQPNAHTSLRRSAGRPFACSGDMYAAVPRIIPAIVIAGVVIVGDCDTCGPA